MTIPYYAKATTRFRNEQTSTPACEIGCEIRFFELRFYPVPPVSNTFEFEGHRKNIGVAKFRDVCQSPLQGAGTECITGHNFSVVLLRLIQRSSQKPRLTM